MDSCLRIISNLTLLASNHLTTEHRGDSALMRVDTSVRSSLRRSMSRRLYSVTGQTEVLRRATTRSGQNKHSLRNSTVDEMVNGESHQKSSTAGSLVETTSLLGLPKYMCTINTKLKVLADLKIFHYQTDGTMTPRISSTSPTSPTLASSHSTSTR